MAAVFMLHLWPLCSRCRSHAYANTLQASRSASANFTWSSVLAFAKLLCRSINPWISAPQNLKLPAASPQEEQKKVLPCENQPISLISELGNLTRCLSFSLQCLLTPGETWTQTHVPDHKWLPFDEDANKVSGLDVPAGRPRRGRPVGFGSRRGRHSGLGARCYANWRGKSASARSSERWRWGNRSQVEAAEVNFASTWLRAAEAFRWVSERPTSNRRRLISPGLADTVSALHSCVFFFLFHSSEQRGENSLPDVQATLLIQIFCGLFSWQRIKMFPVSELCLIERNLWTPPSSPLPHKMPSN